MKKEEKIITKNEKIQLNNKRNYACSVSCNNNCINNFSNSKYKCSGGRKWNYR